MFESKGWCPYCIPPISWRGLTPMQHDDDDDESKKKSRKFLLNRT